MFTVYILQSQRTKQLYVGMTNNLRRRLAQHAAGNVQSTKPFRPYILLVHEEYATKTEARKREIQIKKSGRIRKELKQFVASSSNG